MKGVLEGRETTVDCLTDVHGDAFADGAVPGVEPSARGVRVIWVGHMLWFLAVPDVLTVGEVDPTAEDFFSLDLMCVFAPIRMGHELYETRTS